MKYFTFKSSNGKVDYDIRYDSETGEWNCTCMHGTIGRWQKNMDKPCKHVKKVIKDESSKKK